MHHDDITTSPHSLAPWGRINPGFFWSQDLFKVLISIYIWFNLNGFVNFIKDTISIYYFVAKPINELQPEQTHAQIFLCLRHRFSLLHGATTTIKFVRARSTSCIRSWVLFYYAYCTYSRVNNTYIMHNTYAYINVLSRMYSFLVSSSKKKNSFVFWICRQYEHSMHNILCIPSTLE